MDFFGKTWKKGPKMNKRTSVSNFTYSKYSAIIHKIFETDSSSCEIVYYGKS